LFESYEIKLDVVITNHIINRVKDKIFKHNPERYYVISSKVDQNQKYEIEENILNIQNEHGCQIFIEDPIKLIKRYVRVITKVDDFINILSETIISDNELKIEHKEEWKKIYEGFGEI
jgi:DNA (cytosine-5)-methyltransferase 1